MKKYYVIVLVCAIVIITNSCSNGIVDTEPQIDPFSSSFVWKADTVAYPNEFQTQMESVWGTSPNNLYMVGHCTASKGVMWHYDGKKWSSVNLFNDISSSSITLRSITGTNSGDIWAVGTRNINYSNELQHMIYKSLVLCFNGTKWSDIVQSTETDLTSVWIESNNNIWACGVFGNPVNVVNGVSKVYQLKKDFPWEENFWVRGIRKIGNEYIALASKVYGKGLIRFYYDYRKTGNDFVCKDSFIVDITKSKEPYKWGEEGLMQIDNRLFSYGTDGIFEKTGDGWKIYWNGSKLIRGMYALNEKNIFAFNQDSGVYFYNGSEWKQITALVKPDVYYNSIWSDGKEVFVIGRVLDKGIDKTIVWRGTRSN